MAARQPGSAMRPTPLWLRLAPAVFLLLWSGGFSVLKIGLGHAAPMTFLALRYAAALAVLVPLLLALRPPLPRRAADWAHLAAVGLLGAALVIVARSAIEATSALGIASAAGALAGMTAGTLYEKRFGVAQHPVTSNLVQYAVGFAATFPLAWAVEGWRVAWTGEMLLALGYLVVGNSLVSMTLLL